jgi:hypothetical protein
MSEKTVTGSCLCGAVQYAVSGEAVRFYHCHCQRCRKATGTAHASNLVMRPESSLRWTKGEDVLRRYKVPEAKRFYNLFCQQCGSPMPRPVPELDAVIIPAGTLDTEPAMPPNGRIFWGSRASWSCPDGGLPVFAEYPEKQ